MWRQMITSLLLITLVLSACSNEVNETNNTSETFSRSDFVLATIVSIKLLENGNEALLDQCFERLNEIEALMSVNIEGSDVSAINAQAQNLGKGTRMSPVTVGSDVFKVVEASLYYGDLSGGSFDISLGPIIDAWQIGSEYAHIPGADEIKEKLKLVNYQNVQVNKEEMTVTLEPKMVINLGGIAKGYAADEVETLLRKAGVTKAIINLGGNVKVIGEKETDSPFNIGVQNPFDERNDYIGILSVKDQTIVTSGDYERFFEEDGIRYHHIFDYKTGYPTVTDVASVTVVAETSMDADALSTILFVKGVEAGIDLVNQLDNVACIYVMKNKDVVLSSEALGSVFRLTDDDFTLVNNK